MYESLETNGTDFDTHDQLQIRHADADDESYGSVDPSELQQQVFVDINELLCLGMHSHDEPEGMISVENYT